MPPPAPKLAPDFNSAADDGHITGLKTVARNAMLAKDDTGAVQAIRAVEDYIPDTSDLRRRLYNSLMADAISFGCLPAIDYLLGKSQTGYASGMAHAAQIDQLESFNHFVKKAAKENVELPAIDLETTLLMSTERGAQRVTVALLEMGVNASIHGDRPLQNALKRYHSDGFGPIEDLLRHGATEKAATGLAKKIHPSDTELQEKISGFTRHLREEAAKNYSFDNVSLETLRKYDAVLGTTPLHFAISRGLFKEAIESHVPQLTLGDYLSENEKGETLLAVLTRRGRLNELFKPALWIGQRDKALEVLEQVPEKERAKLGTEAFLREVSLLTLQQSARNNRPRLIP